MAGSKRHITLDHAAISSGQKTTVQDRPQLTAACYSNSKYVNSDSKTCQAGQEERLASLLSHECQLAYRLEKCKLKHMFHYPREKQLRFVQYFVLFSVF